jgi:Zn-dependent peptidase ImmA (M78 family)
MAADLRKEFGLDPVSPLNCIDICKELGIPVIPISNLIVSGAERESVGCLTASTAKFSAMTVASGTKRLIVYNPTHPAGRRANSLAHELSHIILEHPMSHALGVGGCRRWNSVLEDEADWQAGALLVPRQAALEWMQANKSLEEGALNYGVSLPLFRWRVHQTGVVRQIQARQKFQY